jgi:sugar phosphate isomerase/epimerase
LTCQDRLVEVVEALCSTGCFSHDPKAAAIDQVTRGMRQLPGTSFEVIFYRDWFVAAEDMARAIVATRAPTPILHAEKSIGPAFASGRGLEIAAAFDRFEVNCRFARDIGARRVVLHLWGLPDSDTLFHRNLAVLPRLLDMAEAFGLTVSIETLPCRIRTPVEAVARCHEIDSRARVTLDTAFLAMQDELEMAVSDNRLWPSVVDHVHLKDYADPAPGWGAGYLHPGEGTLGLARFIEGLVGRGGVSTVTLEAQAVDRGGAPDVARVEASLDWVRRTYADAVRSRGSVG